jgi:hypothetical protein
MDETGDIEHRSDNSMLHADCASRPDNTLTPEFPCRNVNCT